MDADELQVTAVVNSDGVRREFGNLAEAVEYLVSRKLTESERYQKEILTELRKLSKQLEWIARYLENELSDDDTWVPIVDRY